MTHLKRSRWSPWALAVVLLAPLAAHTDNGGNGSYEVDASGKLVRPTGYREWVFAGTPVTPNDMNNGKAAFPEVHSVYIHPNAWNQWKRTGHFPDGTILVKELISVGSKQAASGAGYFMGEFIGLEAAVKSAKDFPDEPGNWGYFSFSSPDHRTLLPSAAPQATETCNSCHQTAAKDDWVFTQHYPVMRAANGAGKRAGGGYDDLLQP